MLQDIRIRQRDYLIEIARLLTQELDLDVLLWQLLRITLDMLNGKAGFIALYAADEKIWQIKSMVGITTPVKNYIESYLMNIAGDPPESQEAVFAEIQMLIERLGKMEGFEGKNGLGIPLVEQEAILGVIVIFRDYNTDFSLADLSILKPFANQAAIAVRNANLLSEVTEERNRLNAVISSAADGIMVLNNAQEIQIVNPATLKMLHCPEDVILGKPHDQVITFTKVDNGMQLSEGIAGGWPFSRDSRIYVEGDLSSGCLVEKPLPVGITYAPVMNNDNILVNIIAQIRDISKFREADELKNVFISTISHELKTPVALIKGYASTMSREDGEWNQKIILEALGIIEDEADRLNNLVNDLLDASRLYSGTLKLNRSEIDLRALCIRTAEMMQTQTSHHQIISDVPEGLPLVYGDIDRIQQVLINLISNAIKYSDNGEIRILGSTPDDESVQLCVRDEGQGILPDEIDHLFERFFRASRSSNKTKGVGLGLFLSNGIVRGHGGKIWAENRTDRSGAVFCFTLPIDPQTRPTSLQFREF